MTHETDVTEVRRVALVRGGGEATAVTPQAVVGKNDGAGAATGSAGFSAAASPFDDWLGALKTATATAVIRASGLPAVVQERLGAGAYETADDVYAAVERARAELAALREAEVVRLDGLARPGVRREATSCAIRWTRRGSCWAFSSARPARPRRRRICARLATCTWP